MAIPSYNGIYEAAMREELRREELRREELRREKLLYPYFKDPGNSSLNAAAEAQRQLSEQQQQAQACASRENLRRKSLLLLTKKGK